MTTYTHIMCASPSLDISWCLQTTYHTCGNISLQLWKNNHYNYGVWVWITENIMLYVNRWKLASDIASEHRIYALKNCERPS